jgi:hypothetical protein
LAPRTDRNLSWAPRRPRAGSSVGSI